jgi:hypothetical protein
VNAVAVGWLGASAAWAEEGPRVAALAGTVAPVAAEVRLSAELPARVRVEASLGAVPNAYVDLVQSVATSVGWYGPETAALISASLEDSVTLAASVGLRPAPDLGFTALVGARAVWFGGSLTGSEVVAAALGVEGGSPLSVAEVQAAASLHQCTVELGWDVPIRERFVLRPTLGGTFTLGAPVRLESRGRLGAADLSASLLAEGEAYLTDTLTSYVHAPTVGLWVGYRSPVLRGRRSGGGDAARPSAP